MHKKVKNVKRESVSFEEEKEMEVASINRCSWRRPICTCTRQQHAQMDDTTDPSEKITNYTNTSWLTRTICRELKSSFIRNHRNYRQECKVGNSSSIYFLGLTLLLLLQCLLASGMGLGGSSSVGGGGGSEVNSLSPSSPDHGQDHHQQDEMMPDLDNNNAHHLNGNHVREPIPSEQQLNAISRRRSGSSSNGNNLLHTTHLELYGGPHHLHNHQLLNFTMMLRELDQGCSAYCADQIQFNSICVNKGCRNWKTGLREGCSFVCNGSENNVREFYACQIGCSKAIEDYYIRVTGLIGVPDPPTLISDSLKSSSLRLSWEGSALPLPYLVFTVQRRVPRRSQWETIPSSSPQQPLNTTTFTVQSLKPYTEYQFRIGWILTHDSPPYYSRESNPIETLPKGLPNPPEITSIQPISNTSVSVTWLQPSQPNGRLIAYILKLRKLPNGHVIIKEIPISQNPKGYTFTGLQPITNYSLEISAQNVEGEGNTAKVNFVTPQSSMSNDISEKPEPRLLLQGIRDVYIQHLDLFLDPDVFVYNSSQNISATACHYKYKWVFIATGEGDIIRAGLDDHQNQVVVPKERLDLVISYLAVDWLHNQLYIVGKKRHSSNWSIKKCDLNGNSIVTVYPYLFEKPLDFAADPYTGYLYWVKPSSQSKRGGLFKMELNADEFLNGLYPVAVIDGQDLGPFVVDSVNYRILVVHKSRNTVLAVSLDGDVTDIRQNTQSPQFETAQSIAWYNGIFYWTTGQSIVIEEYNAAQDSYYQNLYDVAKVHQPCSRLMVVHPDLQPTPSPMAPPQRVQVIYGQTRARVSWRPPPVISGLGDAAWREWRYQLRLVETNVSYVNVSGSEFIIENLRPSTYYSVQVAASSDSGRGPWAPPVRGKTLRESQYNITFLWGSQSGLFATNTLGENVELLASPSIWLNDSRASRGSEKSVDVEQSTSQPGVGQVGNVYMSSLTWFDSLVFFALSNGSVYYYDTVTNYPANLVYEGPKRNEVTKLTGVPHAESIAFDYIGQKLYWSNPSEQEIRRCSFIKGSVGNRNSLAVNVETVNPCSLSEKAERLQMVTRAREIAVDSYKGMLLWSTEHSLEISTLNGYSPRTLYQTPGLFSGIHIMAITLDTIQSRIYWISRSSRGSTVQSLRYSIQSPQPPMIIAEYDDTSITGPIRYFNDRLIWLQGPSEAVIKDLSGDSKSSLRISSINNITNIHVRDQSAQRYPRGLSRRKIQVYPDPILKWTISLQGKWNNFSINWTPVNNTNFGSIQYEVVVNNSISKITPYANITIDNVASFKPYTDLEIVITSLTSWASSKPIMVRLKTPSWRPSEPLNPRVFVQKLGYPYAQSRVGSNLSTGASSISAEFRWDPPENPNGLILGYLIHSWKDSIKTMERSCDVDMSKPQYPRCAVENLASGSKYYFAIQAFTETGAGNMSSKVLVDTSFNTPVPRVMLVTSDQLQILDIDRNSLEAIPLGYLSPMTAAHFTSEDTVFWFNEGQDLMWSKVGSVNKTRILSLAGQAEANNLVVDWTGRKLYWAYEYTSAGASTLEEKYGIMSLDLVPNWHIPQTPSVVVSSKTPVRSVTVNPFRQGLFWTTARRNGITTLFASETNGSSPRPFLSRDQANCNCSSLSSTGDPIAYDPHGLGRSSAFPSGILFVDKQSIWLGDDNGCNCVRLVTFSTLPFLQNTPYRIAGDEHRVYWTGGFLYASEKLGNGGVTELQPIGAGVREVSVYGPDSQPFPELSCLVPQRMEPMEPHLSNHSSHSLHLDLPRPVTVNCSLGEVSLPTTKYAVYYGTVNENGISECTPTSSSFCKVVTTLENMLHITDLHPYTTYTVFVTLTNYYAEQQGEKPLGCSPIMLRTAPGAPMPPTLLRLEPRTPMSVRVVWRQPEKLNGEKVWYEVYWKSVGAREHNGQKWAETETRSNYDRTEYYLDLVDLLPESNYTIWVIAFSEKGDAFSESERKAVTTFGHPNNITLVKASPHSLRISWVPPNDTSILRHQIMYRDGWSSQWNLTELVDFTIPNKTYEMNITNLKPKTSYGFRIQTWYIGDPKTGLVWPKEDQFNFETLADKPGKPGKPVARGIGRSIYEVTWEKAAENGAVVEVYSLEVKMEGDSFADLGGADSGNQSLAADILMNMTTPSIGKPRRKRDFVGKANQADAEKLISLDGDMRDEPLSEWVVIYNGTDARWQVEELDINKPYSFRVRAKNVYGWGEYSLESVSISLAELTLLPQEAQGFGIILGSIFLACLTLGTCALLTLFLYRGKLKEKPILSGTVSSERREVELATLRELPGGSTFIHQSNFLYARDLLVDVDLASITKVHMQQISFTKFLGSGAFGEVYEGIVSGLENPHEDTRVAIKTLRKGASSLEKLEFIQEAKLMVHFQHPHIIQLLGLCVDTDPCCLLLELMSGGDLLSYLRSHRPNLSSTNSLTILDLIRMCVDVAKGCVYLEEMHFVHRDLAARNCLVQIETALGGDDSRSGSVCRRVVKIGDFGLARDIYRNDYYRKDGEGLLPVRWMSPESLVDGVFTTQSDVWAFGVLLWEIMTLGQQPYPARNNQEVLQYVRGGGRLNLPHHCPQSLYDSQSQLMLGCWEYNSDNRPSFRECHAELEATLQTYESIQIIAQPSAEVTHNATAATIPDKEEEDEYGFCSTNADVHRYHYRRESAPKYIEVIADSGESSEPVSPLRGGVNEGYEVPLPRKPPRRKLPENHSYSSSQSSHSPLEYGLPQPKYWNVDTSSSSQNFQRSNSTSSNIPLLHKSSSTSAEKRNQAFMQDSMEDVQYAEVTSPEEEEASIYSKSSSVNDTPLGYHVMGGGDGEQANGVKFPIDNCQVSLNESPIYTYSYTMPSSMNLAGGLDYHHHRVASSMNAPGFNRQTIDTCGSG